MFCWAPSAYTGTGVLLQDIGVTASTVYSVVCAGNSDVVGVRVGLLVDDDVVLGVDVVGAVVVDDVVLRVVVGVL